MNRFQKNLAQLNEKNRLRSLSKPRGIDFSSNDYLGFLNHPHIVKMAQDALANGVYLGAGASRLLRGHTNSHEALEVYAADHFKTQKALFFANGYLANTAIFQSLTTRQDIIIYDELVHASSRQGIRNTPAHSIKFAHNNMNALEDALKKTHENRRADGLIFVAVESLYSMDGDIAPLHEIVELINKYDAYCIVDEAHSTGVFGDEGEGLSAQDFAGHERAIILHTCGKALGLSGGIVCASESIIDTMINTARGFVYSTAPSPFQAYLVKGALQLCASQEGQNARAKLQSNITFLKTHFADIQSQIYPLIVGEDHRAIEVANAMQDAGYDVRAIRPPTVPEGQARLRISLSAKHDIAILEEFIKTLQSVL